MHPRFGRLTQVIAVVFALAGVGAAVAVLGSAGTDAVLLLALAAGFLMVSAGLWIESIWAWWAGVAVVLVTIILSRTLNSPTGVGFVWPATLVGFVVSGVQGWRDELRAP